MRAIPPKLVAKIQDPDLFKRPARTAERDAFDYSLPGLPPPELTEVIGVRPGFIDIRAGGRRST